MIRRAFFRRIFLAAAVILPPCAALAAPWNLPQTISDRNSSIRYRYTVRGEQIRGKISNVQGRAWVESEDFRRVRTELVIPVPNLSEALGGFGDSFGAALDALQLPPARLSLTRIDGICSPQEVERRGACKGIAQGVAEFGESKRPVSFPIVISRLTRGYRIEGGGSFDPAQSHGTTNGMMLGMIERAEASFSIEFPDG